MSKCEKCGFWNADEQRCGLKYFELSEYCPACYENDELTNKGL